MTGRALYLVSVLMIGLTAYGQDNDKGPLSGLATLRDITSKRASSFDRKGGYFDAVPIKAGQIVTLLDVSGPGSVRHFWATVYSQSKYHLREIVLRFYWDGETDPSVEVPIGDFFGTCFGMYHSWHSLPLTVQGKALNCYFPMPFGNRARITVTNEESQDEFNYPFIGYSRKGNDDATGFHTMYRFHVQDPIYFKKSLHGGIEHGHANSRADDFSSTAYWYQTEPHKKFDPLPPVEKRMPNVHWKIDLLEKGLPD
jgi:hypothetical protein